LGHCKIITFEHNKQKGGDRKIFDSKSRKIIRVDPRRLKSYGLRMKNQKQGTLFLIVGNSGSGKDSMIKEIQKIWPVENIPLCVATRYITRPPHESEPSVYLKPEVFYQLEKEGRFFLTWHIYGHDYGIGKEVFQWISEGINVLVNVSRTIIPKARIKIPSLKVVFISVPYETTTSRLKKRRRESENSDEIKMRLLRAKENLKCPDADFVIENIGPLDQSVLALRKYMLSVV
jgi:ribose 1,5-bisphosphokinase